jgi:hypothetical protein
LGVVSDSAIDLPLVLDEGEGSFPYALAAAEVVFSAGGGKVALVGVAASGIDGLPSPSGALVDADPIKSARTRPPAAATSETERT